jgi:LuxR family maltose regulon positive regulatory protein
MTDAEKSLKKRVRVFSPRLAELLEKVSKAQTAVIEAPPGYGKTTAGECLWSEILPSGVRKIWHTCVDEPGPILWRHFCETISKIDEPTGGRLASLGLPDSDTSGDILFALSDMTCGEQTWLLLDDFHNLERCVADHCAQAAGIRVFAEFFSRLESRRRSFASPRSRMRR